MRWSPEANASTATDATTIIEGLLLADLFSVSDSLLGRYLSFILLVELREIFVSRGLSSLCVHWVEGFDRATESIVYIGLEKELSCLHVFEFLAEIRVVLFARRLCRGYQVVDRIDAESLRVVDLKLLCSLFLLIKIFLVALLLFLVSLNGVVNVVVICLCLLKVLTEDVRDFLEDIRVLLFHIFMSFYSENFVVKCG